MRKKCKPCILYTEKSVNELTAGEVKELYGRIMEAKRACPGTEVYFFPNASSEEIGEILRYKKLIEDFYRATDRSFAGFLASTATTIGGVFLSLFGVQPLGVYLLVAGAGSLGGVFAYTSLKGPKLSKEAKEIHRWLKKMRKKGISGYLELERRYRSLNRPSG